MAPELVLATASVVLVPELVLLLVLASLVVPVQVLVLSIAHSRNRPCKMRRVRHKQIYEIAEDNFS